MKSINYQRSYKIEVAPTCPCSSMTLVLWRFVASEKGMVHLQENNTKLRPCQTCFQHLPPLDITEPVCNRPLNHSMTL